MNRYAIVLIDYRTAEASPFVDELITAGFLIQQRTGLREYQDYFTIAAMETNETKSVLGKELNVPLPSVFFVTQDGYMLGYLTGSDINAQKIAERFDYVRSLQKVSPGKYADDLGQINVGEPVLGLLRKEYDSDRPASPGLLLGGIIPGNIPRFVYLLVGLAGAYGLARRKEPRLGYLASAAWGAAGFLLTRKPSQNEEQ